VKSRFFLVETEGQTMTSPQGSGRRDHKLKGLSPEVHPLLLTAVTSPSEASEEYRLATATSSVVRRSSPSKVGESKDAPPGLDGSGFVGGYQPDTGTG
jgi:hypothetical protein